MFICIYIIKVLNYKSRYINTYGDGILIKVKKEKNNIYAFKNIIFKQIIIKCFFYSI